MVLTRQALSEYDARIQKLGDAAYGAVRRRVTQFMKRFPGASVKRVRDFAIESVSYAVSVYGDAASTCAADLYDEMAEASGAKLPPAILDTSDVSGFIEKEVRYQAGKLNADKMEEFTAAVAAKAADQVSRRANETMRRNSKRDGLRYARVPMGGETCTFCIMLASRGFVYKSAKTAGEGNHFHAHCRCKVVPQFDKRGRETKVEGYDPGELLGRWAKFSEIDGFRGVPRSVKDGAKAAISKDPGLSAREAVWRAGKRPFLTTAADPAADVFGPAEDENPSALAEIKSWLSANDISVKMNDAENERIGFDPGIRRGEPGSLIATEGMSLSAWMHEADHAKYDIENGRPGLGAYMRDTELRVRMEERAYGIEIEKAEGEGYNDLANKLRVLLDAEVKRLRGEDNDGR